MHRILPPATFLPTSCTSFGRIVPSAVVQCLCAMGERQSIQCIFIQFIQSLIFPSPLCYWKWREGQYGSNDHTELCGNKFAAGQWEVGRMRGPSLHNLRSIKQYSIKLEEQTSINKISYSVKIQRVNSLTEVSIKKTAKTPQKLGKNPGKKKLVK